VYDKNTYSSVILQRFPAKSVISGFSVLPASNHSLKCRLNPAPIVVIGHCPSEIDLRTACNQCFSIVFVLFNQSGGEVKCYAEFLSAYDIRISRRIDNGYSKYPCSSSRPNCNRKQSRWGSALMVVKPEPLVVAVCSTLIGYCRTINHISRRPEPVCLP
jgi:hypothetical protein